MATLSRKLEQRTKDTITHFVYRDFVEIVNFLRSVRFDNIMSYAIIQCIYVIISDQRWPSPITIVTNQPHCYRVSHFTHLRISSPFHCVRDCTLFFLKRWARKDGFEVYPYIRNTDHRKIKLIAWKHFQTFNQVQIIFYLFDSNGSHETSSRNGIIENDTHDNNDTINKRNWKKSGKRMRKYRKEILIFPILFLFLILSRYFFLFLYPRIHVLLPPPLSSSLFYILSVSLKRPSPAGV